MYEFLSASLHTPVFRGKEAVSCNFNSKQVSKPYTLGLYCAICSIVNQKQPLVRGADSGFAHFMIRRSFCTFRNTALYCACVTFHLVFASFTYGVCSTRTESFTPAANTAKRKDGRRVRKYRATLGMGWAITTSFLFLFTVCIISLARTEGRTPWVICLAITVK